MKTKLLFLLSAAMICGVSAAITKHYSFAPRQTGSVGGASSVVPVPKKVSDAYDRSMSQMREAKELSIIGKVTMVESGDTVYVTPTGGSKSRVQLSRVVAPKNGQPYSADSKKALEDLVKGKKVTVRYRVKDQAGTVYGILWLGKTEVNLKLLKEGSVLHNSKSDNTEAYVDAARDAKLGKKGIWSTGLNVEFR